MNPQNLESMLQTRFDDCELGNSRNALLPMIGNGIFTQDGVAWKHSRHVLRRQFVRMQRQDTKIFDGPVNDLLADLQSRSEGVVDLQPAFFRFTLAFDYISLTSAIRMRLADWCWMYNPPAYSKACDVFHRYASHYVSQTLDDMSKNREEAATARHPFISDLLKEFRNPDLVRDQLMNVLLAGRDTTACLMSWACYQLIRRPACLERLRQEILLSTQDGEDLTRAQINKMTYLRCVLNETNRLYTQILVNVRIARRTTYQPRGAGPTGDSPLLIPKGAGVGFSAYHMHRSKEIYGPDAEGFRPERWEGPELKNIGFGFMPFRGGPRTCLGSKFQQRPPSPHPLILERTMADGPFFAEAFALTEASFALVRVLQAFPDLRRATETSKVPPGREKQTLTLVVSSAEGCKVLLHLVGYV
ncbi:cytochrome P450 [Aspergillus homomorphus CBS 101889]|uniref:Cytochrome P450 n=1 Tax=Aspergillus homomorphus (strain CBS 101889) TaxID=1450537 RepID=A0A395HR80_ASPHC|nr:cytochrome P450 [Aspergillus homomorphus CBS 101889]RAL10461.1 cytochrome P450 [Aspergillus homomorphus CBS 101889]